MNDARAAKRPFDFKVAIPRLRKAVRPYPKAAMFELAALGHGSVFELLVGCIISVRTRDETTLPASLRLFAKFKQRGIEEEENGQNCCLPSSLAHHFLDRSGVKTAHSPVQLRTTRGGSFHQDEVLGK